MNDLDRDNQQFNEGVIHTVELLASLLKVNDYVAGDGSEDYDSDLQQTLLNILIAKGLYDPEDGSWAKTPQPSPVATRAEIEAAPELVAEAQGHSKRPVGFRFRDSASKTGWGLTQSEDWAANADPNYQGLYVRDGR